MRKHFGITIAAIAFLIFVFGGTLVTLFTDWLWFKELGYTSVFLIRILSRIQLGVFGGLLFFLIVYTNLWIARRFAPPATPRYDTNEIRLRIGSIAQKWIRLVILAAALFVSVMVALETSTHWPALQMFTHSTPFGQVDPIFGRDLGFYVFQLGFLQYIYGWIFFALIVAAIGTAIVHYMDRAIDMIAGVPTFAPHVKAHLSFLFAAILFVKAWGYKLDAFGLLYSTGGKVYGAGYADVHARMVAFQILTVVAILAGVLALVNINRRGIKLPAAALILLVAASFLVGVIYPSIVQRFFVDPNEFTQESKYIAYNIEFTRHAFDLDKIAVKDFPAEDNLTPADLQTNKATIDSVRLWDYRPIQKTYDQLQALGLYYDILNVDIDRYTVKNQLRQVMLAARELSSDKLAGGADSWVNRHFQYTHGYGAVMSPVNEATPDGSPAFFVKNIPPVSTVGLDINRPQTYFGELTNDYVIVDSTTKEFDHPSEGGSEYTNYDGKGGISIGSYIRRLAFAARFGDTNLILSNPITSESRLMFRRLISQRVQTIAPFLTYDHDPYLVISNGNLYWIQDAYTTSDMYPYSTPYNWNTRNNPYEAGYNQHFVNYVRNSVKVVIDAYNGSVDFYSADSADPVLKTYSGIYPGLFKPMSRMPEDLRSHVRFPEDLFTVQTNVLLKYHITKPQIFYTGSNRWQIPNEKTGITGEQTPMDPYYVVMTLPGEKSEEFLLMRPFTPANKNNMVAWMAARCDPEHYGKKLLYLFPTQRLINGPTMIESRIDQDPAISPQLTLWNQQGSRVNRGNLIVIPVEHSILYIKPLYLESDTSKIPQLKRVVVAYGDKIVMADTLNAALRQIFGGEAAPTQPSATAAPSGKPAKAPSGSVKTLIDQANSEFTQAEDAQRKGDWSAYGEHQKRLQETLRQLQQQSGR